MYTFYITWQTLISGTDNMGEGGLTAQVLVSTEDVEFGFLSRKNIWMILKYYIIVLIINYIIIFYIRI